MNRNRPAGTRRPFGLAHQALCLLVATVGSLACRSTPERRESATPESAKATPSAANPGPREPRRQPHEQHAPAVPSPLHEEEVSRVEPFDEFSFERVLAHPARSLALGQAPKAAVLADAPYVFDGKSWQRRDLAVRDQPLSGSVEEIDVFFGRDNEPRLMGTRRTPGEPPSSVYLRHGPHGWKREPNELGPLASSRFGLYGLLGFADPEVVCAPRAFCLIKRTSGWTRIEADSERVPMWWTPHGVYKAKDDALWVPKDGAWSRVVGELGFEPTSVCHETESRLWATGDGAIRLRDAAKGSGFESVAVPLERPSALYCAGDSIWAVGAGGAARYDGAIWRRVAGDFGELGDVTGRQSEEIWFGGERGVFVGRAREPTAP